MVTWCVLIYMSCMSYIKYIYISGLYDVYEVSGTYGVHESYGLCHVYWDICVI